MRIGIDFDNTIADYTGVFYQVAVDLQWIPKSTGQSKREVKQYFIDCNSQNQWTELQGIVYGKEINKAAPYMNCVDALNTLNDYGHELFIISHKTKFPIIYSCDENKVNFHEAARSWLNINDIIGTDKSPINADYVFFNETLTQKVECVADLKCDIFLDDLPSVFSHSGFPSNVEQVLFQPGISQGKLAINGINEWRDFVRLVQLTSHD